MVCIIYNDAWLMHVWYIAWHIINKLTEKTIYQFLQRYFFLNITPYLFELHMCLIIILLLFLVRKFVQHGYQ